ncbi:MAG: hypothetical protein V4658_06430 [Bacteroidota bacterium]
MTTPKRIQLPGSRRSASEEREYIHKAAAKIMLLCAPVKGLSASRLVLLKSSQLEEIGKATRELYGVLEKSGLVTPGR